MERTDMPLILSVDDDDDIRDLITAVLESGSYRVANAASGTEALRTFDELHPDLVLLDVMMPDMDGYEVCDRLQEQGALESTPVIFLSALGSDGDRNKAFACGAVDFIRKPIKADELLGKVEKHLQTTERWKSIAAEVEMWTTSVVPSDFTSYREAMIETADRDLGRKAALEAMTPISVYEAGAAAGSTEEQIARSISEHLGLPFMPAIPGESVLVDSLPAAFCRRNEVVPITDPAGETMYVVSNPFNWELMDLLERQSTSFGAAGMNLAVTRPSVIQRLFNSGSAEESREAHGIVNLTFEGPQAAESGGIDPEAASVVFVANNVIVTAVRQGASDIHIEPKDGHVDVRVRVDGDMQEMLSLAPETGAMLLSRLKALGGLDIAERRKPQDGSLEIQIGERRMKLRMATSSGPYGESMVVRILDVSAAPRTLAELGFTPEQAVLLEDAATRPHGLFLVVGPTGSGKTTTLYSVLSRVDTERRSLMTVEDPVEYIIAAANQQQVNDKAGVTFENLLKSSVRQDPDVLFLGEIRDTYSARTALDFASTGHLTVSTLHTSNATSAMFRLERLGVDRSIMADAVLAIVAQRLVKRVCPHCRSIDPITAEERAQLEPFTDDIPDTVAHAVGCPRCRGGHSGRVGVQEVIHFDSEVAGWVREGLPIAELRERLATRGDYLIADSVIDKVRSFEVSPEDAFRSVLAEERPYPAQRFSGRTGASPVGLPNIPMGEIVPDGALIGNDHSGHAHVLVADDDEDTRTLVGHVLDSQGYDVEYATNGADALDRARTGEFDLVISDLIMPELDGLELLGALGKAGLKVPFLLLTGSDDGEKEAQALGMGASDYVRKPVRKDVLLMRVRRAVTARSA